MRELENWKKENWPSAQVSLVGLSISVVLVMCYRVHIMSKLSEVLYILYKVSIIITKEKSTHLIYTTSIICIIHYTNMVYRMALYQKHYFMYYTIKYYAKISVKHTIPIYIPSQRQNIHSLAQLIQAFCISPEGPGMATQPTKNRLHYWLDDRRQMLDIVFTDTLEASDSSEWAELSVK